MRITKRDIENFVQEPYLSRGFSYFKKKYVQLISISSTRAKARVLGTKIYEVNLKIKNSLLDGNCTCIAYDDYGPCKHIAATGFALIQQNQTGGYSPSQECRETINTFQKFKNYLSLRSKEELVEIIMQIANDNPDILYEYEDDL